jgi:hypothetical protein
VACRFPNGATGIAAHYRSHVESWPGGFHRDPEQDKELLARNPLPPSTLKLRDYRVNGHTVNFDGDLAMAFRLDAGGSLIAFSGYICQKLTVDGRELTFASRPVAHIAWAPVLPERQVPGGAIMEIWVLGEADITLPLPAGVKSGRLFLEGGRLGAFGREVECACADGTLRFNSRNAPPHKHLYFVPA